MSAGSEDDPSAQGRKGELKRAALAAVASLVALAAPPSRALAASTHATHPPAPSWWVRGAFAACVRERESHDGADPRAQGNLYGVQDRNGGYGWARNVPRAEQDYIAWKLYQRYGVQPWRPFDGC
jgi:hypothetical protein